VPGWFRILQEQAIGIHDHTRRTVPTLQSIVFHEGILQWVQLAIMHEALDGKYFFALYIANGL
jgi:hypothetical protein